jgi:hypothetical protein
MVVHSVLPESLTGVVTEVLRSAGITHCAHGYHAPMWGAEVAAGDPEAVALVGPYRSRDVADAVEATAPQGLPLIAPVATWAGVTRDDEPGCDDPAHHRGTLLRMVARDTFIAQRIAADLVATGRRAPVVAGDHEYGIQLDGQLRLAGLPRADDPDEADVLILAGLAGEPEVERALALAPLPIIGFDGVQGADLGTGREVRLALPHAPADGVEPDALFDGREAAREAGRLIVAATQQGAAGRDELLAALRQLGPFDEHGDPVDPPVWLWRADENWNAEPDRSL